MQHVLTEFRLTDKSVEFFSDDLFYTEKCIRYSLYGFCKTFTDPSNKSVIKEKEIKINITARWR